MYAYNNTIFNIFQTNILKNKYLHVLIATEADPLTMGAGMTTGVKTTSWGAKMPCATRPKDGARMAAGSVLPPARLMKSCRAVDFGGGRIGMPLAISRASNMALMAAKSSSSVFSIKSIISFCVVVKESDMSDQLMELRRWNTRI